MSTHATLTGRCLCGAVRYRTAAPLAPPTCCHCESCRRASGAHAVVWISVARASLEFTAQPPVTFESSPGIRRTFCARCGSPLTYWNPARAAEIDLTVGSLDDAARHAPHDHIWMQDAPAWDRPADGLPTYPRSRPEG